MGKGKEEKPKKVEQPKKEKQEKTPNPPQIRDMRRLKALRVVLYIGLLGLLGFGILSIIRGDGIPELKAELESTEISMRESISIHTEAQAFAQNFVREYLTYEGRQTEGYKKRLEQYCPVQLASDIAENIMLRDAADAVYTLAIDTAEYGKNQYDITVRADVLYTKYQTAQSMVTTSEAAASTSKEIPLDVIKSSTIYLIVPVWSDGEGGFAVEDMPMVTAPPNVVDYSRQAFSGTSAADGDKAAAQQMLNDFFGALYTEPQNKIDYYLAEDANKARFTQLNSDLKFVKIENLLLYQATVPSEYTGIVTIKIVDTNGTDMRQRFNIQLVKKEKFYAKDINLRTYNLKG